MLSIIISLLLFIFAAGLIVSVVGMRHAYEDKG